MDNGNNLTNVTMKDSSQLLSFIVILGFMPLFCNNCNIHQKIERLSSKEGKIELNDKAQAIINNECKHHLGYQ